MNKSFIPIPLNTVTLAQVVAILLLRGDKLEDIVRDLEYRQFNYDI